MGESFAVEVGRMPGTYRFPRTALRRIAKAAREADIHELCYVVLGRGARVERVLRVPNRAADTVLHHEIRVADFERVRRKQREAGLKCLGLLHTHPLSEAVPGPGDVSGYAAGTLLFIYGDCSEELRAYRLTGGGAVYVEKQIVLI